MASRSHRKVLTEEDFEKRAMEAKQMGQGGITAPDGVPTTTQPLDSLMRHIKWEYVIPIVFTPSAHIFVSLLRKYPQHRRKLLIGVGVATFLTLQARLILMYDAGYAGHEKVDREGLPAYLKILLF
eukprot:gene6591-7284_t